MYIYYSINTMYEKNFRNNYNGQDIIMYVREARFLRITNCKENNNNNEQHTGNDRNSLVNTTFRYDIILEGKGKSRQHIYFSYAFPFPFHLNGNPTP